MRYLYPNQILHLHKQIISQSGGSWGVRDKGLLESAVYRPQASFGGQDLYPHLFAKAAALGHSIILNHPFVDGNKRTGFEALCLMLRINGYRLHAGENAKFHFILKAAEKKINERETAEWLETHSQKYS